MNRVIHTVLTEGAKQTLIFGVCGHKIHVYNEAKWRAGDQRHCRECAIDIGPTSNEVDLKPIQAVTYRIRATEILPFHMIGKREPLVRYYLEGNIKDGMKFADKRDAQDIVDALDHEQLTAVTFLIKFRHEVVEVSNEF